MFEGETKALRKLPVVTGPIRKRHWHSPGHQSCVDDAAMGKRRAVFISKTHAEMDGAAANDAPGPGAYTPKGLSGHSNRYKNVQGSSFGTSKRPPPYSGDLPLVRETPSSPTQHRFGGCRITAVGGVGAGARCCVWCLLGLRREGVGVVVLQSSSEPVTAV